MFNKPLPLTWSEYINMECKLCVLEAGPVLYNGGKDHSMYLEEKVEFIIVYIKVYNNWNKTIFTRKIIFEILRSKRSFNHENINVTYSILIRNFQVLDEVVLSFLLYLFSTAYYRTTKNERWFSIHAC